MVGLRVKDTIIWPDVRFSSARRPTVVPFKFPGGSHGGSKDVSLITDYAWIRSPREIDSPAKGSKIQ